MASEKEAIDEGKKLDDDSIEVKDVGNGKFDNGVEGKAGEAEEDGKEKEVNGEEKSEEERSESESEDKKDEDEVEKQEEDGNTEDEAVEKESKEEKGGEIGELSSPRPTRERKTVERFTVTETPKGTASKPLAIEKGRGTQLKDIPNVAFKLSKRKADENLQQLHHILFGRKAKVQTLKRHLGLFSGFVWAENEQEKQRAKTKEKIDKCVKDKLLDFCDILNIPVNKTTVKKEELSSKLLEFLESPYATTPNLLSEKEKAKKRAIKDKNPGSNGSSGKSAKKQKKSSEFVKEKPSDDEESDHEIEPLKSEGESNHEENESEKESDGDRGESQKNTANGSSSKKTPKKDAGSSKKAAKKDTVESSGKSKSISKGSSNSASKKRAAETESKGKSKTKTSPAKKQKVEKEAEEHATSPSKGSTTSSKKKSTKVGEGQSSSKKTEKTKEPMREEMHEVVADILKKVDFNTATLSDILRQLGEHFKVDLMSRKSEIKDIITDVINNMSDEEDEENESGNDGEGGDE